MPAKTHRVRLREQAAEPPKPRTLTARQKAKAEREAAAAEGNYKYARVRKKTDLDEDLLELICTRLSEGQSLVDIAAALCIDITKLNVWKIRGEAFNSGEGKPGWELCGVFVMAVGMAKGEYNMANSTKIHTSKDWFRFMQIAARRDPQTWGKDPKGGSHEEFNPDDTYL